MPPNRNNQGEQLNTGLETIGHADCLRLLAECDIGRLGVVAAGTPEIFPVNYIIDGGFIVFRTGLGTKLAGVLVGPIVFEVDHFDSGNHSGWSVVVHGNAERIWGPDTGVLHNRLARCAVQPAPGGDKAHLFRVLPSSMTGRRVRPPQPPGPATPESK